jgi:serine/threonine protein kinase
MDGNQQQQRAVLGYQQQGKAAFNYQTHVATYRATRTLDQHPVYIKKHEFHFIDSKESQERITSCINAAICQAKMQHPNTCELLEVQLEIREGNCYIYHVLEPLVTSVGKDIQEHIQDRRGFKESEICKCGLDVASALAHAHNMKIAHRDVKPDNIFRTRDTYKIGDLDCFFMNRETSNAISYAGDGHYMSPQLRAACLHGTPYNAYKADVFALGATFLHMATLQPTITLLTSQRFKEEVDSKIEMLICSEELKWLLKRMLAYEERERLTMKDVCLVLGRLATEEEKNRLSRQPTFEQLRPPPPTAPEHKRHPSRSFENLPVVLPTPELFAAVWGNKVQLYNFGIQHTRETKSIPINFGDGGSYIPLHRNTLLCLGGNPPSEKVYELNLSPIEFTGLPSLRSKRASAGVSKAVVRGDTFIYAFGGASNRIYLRTCEKYRLGDNRWVSLPDMSQKRCYFTPCTFEALIYLISPHSDHLIETFNPQTDSFNMLRVSCPLNGISVSFVVEGEIYVLTENSQMGRWKIGSESRFEESVTNKPCGSSQPPLVLGSIVLIANNCNGIERVEKFDLRTFTFDLASK